MRNLKKVLALVLALAMVMTMFAGAISIEPQADDYAELTAAGQDAYDVLNVLGVVTGYTDNTVRGNVPVTRAEAAAFIYRLKTGDVDGTAAFYGDATLPFSDYIADWAKPYVAFANLNGIMVGANGQFRPDDYVTGLEFAKMVLVALGYDATANGFVGSNWAYNVATKATQVGILKGINATLEGAMTRENVMIMLANAVYTDMAGSNQPTLGEKVFDLMDMNAVLVANDHAAIGAYWVDDSALAVSNDAHVYRNFADYISYNNTAAGYSRFVYKDYSVNEANAYEYYVITAAIESDFADLGKEYRILSTGYNGLTYPSNEIRTVYGVIGESENATITTGTRATVKVWMNGKVLNVGGKNMVTDGSKWAVLSTTAAPDAGANDLDKTIFVNAAAVNAEVLDRATNEGKGSVAAGTYNGLGAASGNTMSNYNDNNLPTTSATARVIGNSTAPVYYVDNNQDGVVDFLWVADYALGTVSAVADGSVTITSGVAATTYKDAEYVLSNGDALAVGDYVFLYKTDLTYIKKLDVVNGSISGFASGLYTINGVGYALSEKATERAKDFLAGSANMLSASNYTFITDEDANNHFIVDVLVNENTSFNEYGVIADDVKLVSGGTYVGGTYFYKPYVRIFTDGNEFIIKSLASINGVSVYQYVNMTGMTSVADLEAGDLVSYVVDGDDVHITTALASAGQDYAAWNANNRNGSFYDAPATLVWNNAIGYWTSPSGVILDTTSATVFAIDELAEAPNTWKAYTNNFYDFANVTADADNEYIAYQYSGYNARMIKVLKVALENIPATTLGLNGKLIIANGAAQTFAYDSATGIFTYEIPVISPYGSTEDALKFQSKSNVLSNAITTTGTEAVTKGHAYKLNDFDADGYVDYIEKITSGVAYNAAYTNPFATDIGKYFHVVNAEVTGFYYNKLTGEKMISVAEAGGAAKYLNIANDAVLYTVENLATSVDTYDFATYSYDALYAAFNGINASTAVHEGVFISGILASDGVTLTTAIINVVDAD